MLALITSLLLLLLATCSNDSSDVSGTSDISGISGDATPPIEIGVERLRVIPAADSATLIWDNPGATITNISINYKSAASGNFTEMIITDASKIAPSTVNITEVIDILPALTNVTETNYTFNVRLRLGGADENKTTSIESITRLIGPNLDGDEYADGDPLELDTDGDGFPDATDGTPRLTDSDNDMVGDSVDLCNSPGSARHWRHGIDGAMDNDNDGCRAADEDVDDDGDGLIEIATVDELYAIRYNLGGTSFKITEDAVGDAAGCGGQDGITACNGYELAANISLSDYDNWQPIGECFSYREILNEVFCNDPKASFNSIFDGNGHIISNLTIINDSADYVNGSGLFGAITSPVQLRNVHIRDANISGGFRYVGVLVGFTHLSNIASSSVQQGEINTNADNVGTLVGYGFGITVSSSYVAETIISGGENVGGLVGNGVGATITSSYVAETNVSGGENVGGLVGNGVGATITSSYVAETNVSGDENVGGLIGTLTDSMVLSSYVLQATVNGTAKAGGFVGLISGSGSDNISASYVANTSITRSSGSEDTFGALIGNVTISPPPTLSQFYWDSNTTFVKGVQVLNATDATREGMSQTMTALQSKVAFDGIYSDWGNGVCNPVTGEFTEDNVINPIEGGILAWNLGTAGQYPALTCTPGGTSAQAAFR